MNQESERIEQKALALVPGVGSSYGNAWRQLWRKYFIEVLLITIVAGLISLPGSVIGNAADGLGSFGVLLGLMALAYLILLTNPIEYGASYAYLKAARDDDLKIKDMFQVFQNYWHAVLANILVGFIIGLGVLMLIVPGIIFACRLAFTPYLVVDRKMDVIPAVKQSWRMTRGHANKVFLIGLLSIPIALAGLICLFVGIIISIMWIEMAFASLYHAVSGLEGEAGLEGAVKAEPIG